MTRRKPVLLPFRRPEPPGGYSKLVIGPSRNATTITLEYPWEGPRPHIIAECNGRTLPITYHGMEEYEPVPLIDLAPLTQQQERGPA
jgi:hypothetical protein